MKTAQNTMLCWNAGGPVALVPWPDVDNKAGAYQNTALACWIEVRAMSVTKRRALVMSEALTLMVRDMCHPARVHDALLELSEYRESIPEDMRAPYDHLHPRRG
jgi:hypothetical protein